MSNLWRPSKEGAGGINARGFALLLPSDLQPVPSIG